MNKNIFRAAALAALAAFCAAPALSSAAVAVNSATHTIHANYNTTMGPIVGFGAPFEGTLQLTITSDGIINGYYRPAYDESFIPVTGGRNGRSVWLDIGEMGRLHVNGTLQHGNINGTAIDDATMEQCKFNAKLS